MLNALSVDVEDYFHVSAFATTIDPSTWDQYDCRVERNTLALLDLFERRRTTGTFFVLGWIAKRFPGLVKEIHARGHEVGSHGDAHRTLDRLSAAEFRREVREQKALLEDLTQSPVLGYRAPSFSITRNTTWALQILSEEGYRYDSSVFPVRHDRYGIPDAPRFPHDVALPVGTLREFPLSTLSLRGLPNLPIGGGGYLRIYPFWFTRWGLRKINRGEGQPVVVYLHPWEIDPEQPRVHAPPLSRWRHYTNLNSTARRVDRLLGEFRFAPMRTVLGFATESAPDSGSDDAVVSAATSRGYAQATASNGSRHNARP
jgi:polysaccharide deacetylase family protein (PEP-CTERM system associated)